MLSYDVPHLGRHFCFDGKCGLPWNSDSLNCGFVNFAPDTGPYIDGLEDLTAPHTNEPTTLDERATFRRRHVGKC